jgi:hypothetical protein
VSTSTSQSARAGSTKNDLERSRAEERKRQAAHRARLRQRSGRWETPARVRPSRARSDVQVLEMMKEIQKS